MQSRVVKLTFGVMITVGMSGLALAQDNAQEQQQQVRPLLEEHHNRIQALLDKNPNASRQELGPQIHAISDETHREIHALLSDHQKQLEKAMQQREHRGEENRRPAPLTTPSPEPSPRGLLICLARLCLGQG